ncbi:cell envelope biogenesis protein TolA [Bradyrhizobium sp. BR13661]|jgi:colicin import membrane protein|uniref:cell envelope biogenesis protein TolA n=1 Tax=Bradyrhizobium sp. BR13661 TaxID=2940622 RepID=UPI0024754542|nr:cell envelope biogenesis protein TolA [Bradyrhizobium sp. BR13661]MDH6258870.1 colicin import membrane protein [Bradyrhizobium sp. BR13661]
MPRSPSRKLKTYQTSLGFYDQAVAAPSMKAALDAWGARSNLFHQGIAKETDDPDIIAATMAAPGIVLRRPVGSDGPFTEHAKLPTDLADDEGKPASRSRSRPKPKSTLKSKTRPAKRATRRAAKPEIDDRQTRAAAAAFEREEARRENARRKEEAARAKARARRDKAVAAAQAALDKARRDHEARADEIEAERAALDERAGAEEARWDKQRRKLEEAVRKARE